MRLILVGLLFVRVAAAAPRMVDSSLREGAFRTQTVGFDNAGMGWLSNDLGEVYRSSDDGITWQLIDKLADPIVAFRFPSSLAVALTSAGKVFSSVDGGHRWRYVDTATGQAFCEPAIEVIGAHVWVSGRDAVTRSEDGGLSFLRLSPSSCPGISFVNAQDGWLVCGVTILATIDGGDHFSRLPSPPADSVQRLSADLAWILSARRLYRTVDGGHHWRDLGQYAVDYLHIHAVEDGLGRLHARSNDAASKADGIPIFQSFIWWGRSGLMCVESRGSPFHSGMRFRTLYPTIRIGPPLLEPLLAELEIADRRWYGASLDHIYHSDDGVRWYVVGDAPAPIARIAFLDAYEAIAQSKDGSWFRADGGGRRWQTSRSVDWDRFELERALGLPSKGPLSCLMTANHAALAVDFGFRGCDITRHHVLHLSLDQPVQLSGQLDGEPRVERSLDAAAARQLVSSLVAAVEHPDVRAPTLGDNPEAGTAHGSVCNRASLHWVCDWASGSLDLPRGELMLSPPAYSRTNRLNELATAALR